MKIPRINTCRIPPPLGIVHTQACCRHWPGKAIRESFVDQLGPPKPPGGARRSGKRARAWGLRPLEVDTVIVLVRAMESTWKKARRFASRDQLGCANKSPRRGRGLTRVRRWVPSGRIASSPLTGPADQPKTIVRPSGD
jgi:hypothetical protein